MNLELLFGGVSIPMPPSELPQYRKKAWPRSPQLSCRGSLWGKPTNSRCVGYLLYVECSANYPPKVSYPLLEASSSESALDLDQPVQLTAVANPTGYELFISVGDARANIRFASEALTVFPPVGGAFCGVMFGIYSFGRSEPVLDPSDFADIEILETEYQ